MRIPVASVAVVLLLVVGLTACSPSGDAASGALASQVESLEEELSDARRTIAEQQIAFDEAQAEIERQTAAIETQAAIEDKQTEAIAEAVRLMREAEAAATRGSQDVESLRNLACTFTETELPDDVPDALIDWLIETQSDLGQIPADLTVTVVEAAGRDGDWAFLADFNARFEPGVYFTDANRDFVALWAGVAPSESGIWNYLAETYPDGDVALAACLDLSLFIES